jgi:hypothetical protein
MASASPTVWRRVLTEKRSLLLPLVAGIVLNLGLYALVVYPLGVKSAGAADRAVNAAKSLRAAEQDYASARALVAGKSRADEELTTFYGKVLPSDQMAAVRLTYVPLPNIARKANVRVVARRWTPEQPGKDARLGRLHIVAALQGDYESLRQFIYELETAPEFVIIDDVTLLQAEVGKPLTLTLELSTYYPLGAHGN